MSFLKSIKLGNKTMNVFSDDDSQQLITREEFNDELGNKQNKLIQENGIIIDPDSDEIFIDLTKFKGIIFDEPPVSPTDDEKQTLYIDDNKWYKWDSGENDWVVVGEGEISDDYKKILFTAPPATPTDEQKKNLYINDNKLYAWDEVNEKWDSAIQSLKYVKDYDANPTSPNNGVVLGDVDNNIASGQYSVAEGQQTEASGEASHAEGNSTIASGPDSHAEGFKTIASGADSHAEGLGTKAAKRAQHVQGKYNIEDTDTSASGKYAHIVGNGTDFVPSNAHTLDWEGNAWYAGKVTAGADPTADMDLVTKRFLLTQLANLEHPKMTEVATLPTTGQQTNTIYLVPKIGGGYEMYIWDEDNSDWVDLGKDEVDLSEYLKTADAETVFLKLADAVTTYLKIADAENTYRKIADSYTKTEVDNTISEKYATVAPLMDGTAAVGVSTKFAKEDHVHPTNTTLAPLDSPAFTGTPTAPTVTDGLQNDEQLATTAFVQKMYKTRTDFGTFYNKSFVPSEIIPNAAPTPITIPEAGVLNNGRYVGSITIRWKSNTVGRRYVQIGRTNSGAFQWGGMTGNMMPVSGSDTFQIIPITGFLPKDEKFALNVYQNSGGNLSIEKISYVIYGFES